MSDFDMRGLEQLKRDFRRLTKIYRDIPTSYEGSPIGFAPQPVYDAAKEQAHEAARIFVRFKNTLRTWTHKTLGLVEESQRSYIAKTVLSALSDLLHEGLYMGDLFPEDRSRGGVDINRLSQNADKNVRRFQKNWREYYKSIQSLLEVSGGSLAQMPSEEVYQIQGVRVLVDNSARARDGSDDETFERFLDLLGGSLGAIRKAGFSKALDGLTITVDFKGDGLTAGKYNPRTDKLTMYPFGVARARHTGAMGTLVHEIGHRYYYRVMSPQARAYYEEMLGKSKIQITRSNVERYLDLIHFDRNDYERTRREKYQVLNALRGQLSMKHVAALQWIIEDGQYPGLPEDEMELRRYMFNHVGKTIPFEYITDYGNSEPVEAFAESFRLYVLQGPRALRPLVREVFETAARSGRTASASWDVEAFFKRHSKLRKYKSQLEFKNVTHSGAGSHPNARYHRGGTIELYPTFIPLDDRTKDFVVAHEIGHHVQTEFGLQNMINKAYEMGIDPWDTFSLPFGQFQMEEAFADCFASYHTDGDVKKRYPKWTKLVELMSK